MSRALGTALFGLLLCLCGAAFDSVSLYVPGVALALLGAIAAVWVALAARGAALSRELGPATVEEDEPYPLALEATTGVLPAPGGDLVEPLLDRPLPMLGCWERTTRLEVRFARRGRRRLPPARLELRDPLALARRTLVTADEGEVLVLPRVEPVEARAEGGADSSLRVLVGARPGPAAELELDSVRPYREGTPASRIHWPTVARSGEMMERRMVGDSDSRPLVVMDARRPVGEEELDRAVRAAASLALHLARAGGCAIALPGLRRPAELDPDLRGWPAVHARLALVEPGEAPPGAALRGRRGALLWVTAARPDSPPPGLSRTVASVRWLVGPLPLPGRPVAFAVAGCVGQRLGRVSSPVEAAA